MIHHNILFHQVTEVLKTFYPISPGFVIRLGDLIDFAEYRAGDIILHYKEIQRFAWMQSEGVSVEVTIDRRTREEITTWFWFTGDFIYSVPGFFSLKK